ncbi:MAG: hypothetical protein Tsb0020_25260 [Haliangiales bacterium]
MRQHTATRLAAVLAGASLLGVLALSTQLATERQHERQSYLDAIAQQRRAAGRVRPLPPALRPAPSEPQRFCVRGVETFASALSQALPRALVPAVIDDEGELDVDAFRTLSALSVRAERYVEQATAGPALPQRLGRTRASPTPAVAPPRDADGVDADQRDDPQRPGAAPARRPPANAKAKRRRPRAPAPSAAEETSAASGPIWQPWAPARIPCEGGEAYRQFRLDLAALAPPG